MSPSDMSDSPAAIMLSSFTFAGQEAEICGITMGLAPPPELSPWAWLPNVSNRPVFTGSCVCVCVCAYAVYEDESMCTCHSKQHEPEGQILFCLGGVTYLLDVAPSNPLPHPLSPPPIPLQDHKIWLLSNIQQKHMPTTCSRHTVSSHSMQVCSTASFPGSLFPPLENVGMRLQVHVYVG